MFAPPESAGLHGGICGFRLQLEQPGQFVQRASDAGVTHVRLIVGPGIGPGWGDFWKSSEDVTAFADWYDQHLRDGGE